MPGPDPLISIVLPVYDEVAHPEDAVRSVQARTDARWELIIVDDGSRDGSGHLAERLARADRRVRTIGVEHGGAAPAVNAGATLARGDCSPGWTPTTSRCRSASPFIEKLGERLPLEHRQLDAGLSQRGDDLDAGDDDV